MSERITELRAAIDAADWRRALDLALAAWRDSRAVELADVVDAIAARIDPPRPPRKYRHEAWIADAMPYDPHEVGTLVATASRLQTTPLTWEAVAARHGDLAQLAALAASDTHNYLRRWHLAIVDRFAAVSRWPDDPRTAAMLLRWLADMPAAWSLVTSEVFYRQIADQLVALADWRIASALQRLIAEPTSMTHVMREMQVRIAIAALPRLSPPAPDPIAAALLADLRPPAAIDADPLWRQVAAAPDDDGPRHVLADALIERADPRGELIALQLAGDAGRAARLIKQHWRAWLGDLALVLTRRGSAYRRGMLDEVRVGMHHTPAWAFGKARGHRELSAVRVVRAHQVSAVDFAQFCDALDHDIGHLDVRGDAFAGALAAVRPRWGARRLDYGRASGVIARPSLAASLDGFAAILPDLEHLHFTVTEYPIQWAELAGVLPGLPARMPRLRRITIPRSLVPAGEVLPAVVELV